MLHRCELKINEFCNNPIRLADMTDATEKRLASWTEKKIPTPEQPAVEKAFTKTEEAILGPEELPFQSGVIIKCYYAAAEAPREIWEWQISSENKGKKRLAPEEDELGRMYVDNGTTVEPCQSLIKHDAAVMKLKTDTMSSGMPEGPNYME
ncbi:hypothetical protein R1sor_020542 [Riccia sorocarpa]|uniref:Ig-like domain-containing protein n=1 Tax=Riccia sorocarpa TaxID=122646 RepID=A0ABD3IJC3_9MARC